MKKETLIARMKKLIETNKEADLRDIKKLLEEYENNE